MTIPNLDAVEQYQLNWFRKNFRNYRYLFNRLPPGTRKSTVIIQFMHEMVSAPHFLKFVFVVTNHKMANDTGKRMRSAVNKRGDIAYPFFEIMHLSGKTCFYDPKTGMIIDEITKKKEKNKYRDYEAVCRRSSGQKYNPGCENGNCPFHKNCYYRKQRDQMSLCNVIICTADIARYCENRVVVFDDSFESYPMATKTFESIEEARKYGIDFEEEYTRILRRAKSQEKILENGYYSQELLDETKKLNDNFTGESILRHLHFKGFEKVKVPENFYRDDESTCFLKHFFSSTDPNTIHARIHGDGKITVFGYRDCIPRYHKQIIFNSGTTSLNLAAWLLHVAPSDICTCVIEGLDTNGIENNVYHIGNSWCKSSTENHIERFSVILREFRLHELKVLIITKKAFEDKLKKEFPDLKHGGFVDYVHYMDARGSNKVADEEFNAIFVFGAFHYDPFQKEMLKLSGYHEEFIPEMEINETYEAIYRARLITTNKRAPIFLMCSQSVFETKPIIIPFPVIELILSNLDIDLDKLDQKTLLTYKKLNGTKLKLLKLYAPIACEVQAPFESDERREIAEEEGLEYCLKRETEIDTEEESGYIDVPIIDESIDDEEIIMDTLLTPDDLKDFEERERRRKEADELPELWDG